MREFVADSAWAVRAVLVQEGLHFTLAAIVLSPCTLRAPPAGGTGTGSLCLRSLLAPLASGDAQCPCLAQFMAVMLAMRRGEQLKVERRS